MDLLTPRNAVPIPTIPELSSSIGSCAFVATHCFVLEWICTVIICYKSRNFSTITTLVTILTTIFSACASLIVGLYNQKGSAINSLAFLLAAPLLCLHISGSCTSKQFALSIFLAQLCFAAVLTNFNAFYMSASISQVWQEFVWVAMLFACLFDTGFFFYCSTECTRIRLDNLLGREPVCAPSHFNGSHCRARVQSLIHNVVIIIAFICSGIFSEPLPSHALWVCVYLHRNLERRAFTRQSWVLVASDVAPLSAAVICELLDSDDEMNRNIYGIIVLCTTFSAQLVTMFTHMPRVHSRFIERNTDIPKLCNIIEEDLSYISSDEIFADSIFLQEKILRQQELCEDHIITMDNTRTIMELAFRISFMKTPSHVYEAVSHFFASRFSANVLMCDASEPTILYGEVPCDSDRKRLANYVAKLAQAKTNSIVVHPYSLMPKHLANRFLSGYTVQTLHHTFIFVAEEYNAMLLHSIQDSAVVFQKMSTYITITVASIKEIQTLVTSLMNSRRRLYEAENGWAQIFTLYRDNLFQLLTNAPHLWETNEIQYLHALLEFCPLPLATLESTSEKNRQQTRELLLQKDALEALLSSLLSKVTNSRTVVTINPTPLTHAMKSLMVRKLSRGRPLQRSAVSKYAADAQLNDQTNLDSFSCTANLPPIRPSCTYVNESKTPILGQNTFFSIYMLITLMSSKLFSHANAKRTLNLSVSISITELDNVMDLSAAKESRLAVENQFIGGKAVLAKSSMTYVIVTDEDKTTIFDMHAKLSHEFWIKITMELPLGQQYIAKFVENSCRTGGKPNPGQASARRRSHDLPTTGILFRHGSVAVKHSTGIVSKASRTSAASTVVNIVDQENYSSLQFLHALRDRGGVALLTSTHTELYIPFEK